MMPTDLCGRGSLSKMNISVVYKKRFKCLINGMKWSGAVRHAVVNKCSYYPCDLQYQKSLPVVNGEKVNALSPLLVIFGLLIILYVTKVYLEVFHSQCSWVRILM